MRMLFVGLVAMLGLACGRDRVAVEYAAHDLDCLSRGILTPGTGQPPAGWVRLVSGSDSIFVPVDCVDTWTKEGVYRLAR